MLLGFLRGKEGSAEMNPNSTMWRCILVLIFSIKDSFLHRAGYVHFNDLGNLTVKPPPPFLLGSNLTVYCHVKKCTQRSKIFLDLQNGEILAPSERINCTASFHLINVRAPQFSVICKLEIEGALRIVNGLYLQGGYPPDKPGNIICVTTKSSDSILCSWGKGQDTFLPTVYEVSVKRKNRTQVLINQIQGAEEIFLPRARIDENTTYLLTITAYNHFGVLQSDPFPLCAKDIVLPETPHIMHIEFENNSIAALLQWKTAKSSEHVRPCVRLRTNYTFWTTEEGAEPSEGLIKVEGLKPLTDYEFQIRTCLPQSEAMHTNRLCSTASPSSRKKLLCSKWSTTVRRRSPGKGPSHPLHVWRILGHMRTNRLRMVTVLWKPPSPEDYSGELQHYIISYGNDKKKYMTCAAALSQCSVQVPAEVQVLSISVVTLYGTSPSADVLLKQSGNCGPVLKELSPAAHGSAVFVSWSWGSEIKNWSSSGDKLLYYVLEWTSIPVAEQQWQKLDKDRNTTSITGLAAGVRYNISLFAVTTRGASAPSSRLVYSKEQKPQVGPSVSVLVHEPGRIQIKWDELPVDQQRGFITNYTIYLQTVNSENTEVRVTVSGSDPRQKWLDCPDGALMLQMTASTSAGEGPRGSWISSQPAAPAVGLMVVMVFIITLFIGILANLLCWSCVRESIKQKCISWGPACVGENLPKPDNSVASILLQHDRSEVSFPSTYSDPPLSPVSLLSQEEREVAYPNVHIELYQVKPGQSAVETPLLLSDPEVTLLDCQLEHVSYKPQISTVAVQGEELKETEEQMNTPTSGQEDTFLSISGGLLRSFLSNVEADSSVSPLRKTLGSVSPLLWPKTAEKRSVLKEDLPDERRAEKDVEVDSPCQDLQQCETMICDPADAYLSQCKAEASLTGGYFPQVAAVCRTTHSTAQR
ncbi:interleukin-23 receptor [Xyrichtys novacula]|uniref:Interleukin-23 receptor n=1 Tax=Xyrichtys novacula TaxID=13765 RepID=A0AAV1FG94_XYRNO|nr:interleukin-23 receptor [Xyrichtys novacula]